MTNKEKVAEFVNNNPEAGITEIVKGCGLSKSTVYRYLREIREIDAAVPAESETDVKEDVAVADEDTSAVTYDGKTYSTREQRGYSAKQMSFVYAHCKNHDLFIAKPVLELMYSWADKFDFKEADEAMEDLRNAACKVVKCVSLGNFVIAQKKVRYIESVLKKRGGPEAA